MSSDFSTYLVKDSRINNITSQSPYSIYQGAATNTFQSFAATSTSTSQISFNVNVPSENTILDREILIQATYKMAMTIPVNSTTAIGEVVFQYGLTDAYQAFPINSSITSMNCSINNTNVSINSQDVLPILLRMLDPRDLQRYNGFTPTYCDQQVNDYQVITVDGNNNPLGSLRGGSLDNMLLGRGIHPLDSIDVVHNKQAGGTDQKLTSTHATGDSWVITFTSTFTEPLFLSPFIFGHSRYNAQGLVGINTLTLNLNIDASGKRVFSSAKNYTNATIAITEITNARLLVNFLTSQVGDVISAKNVVPYVDFPRFITGTANTASIASLGTGTITTQNIQLNQIPDRFIIAVRRPIANQTFRDPNHFLPITGVSVNFNNASGLLSSATAQDLYQMSKVNGSMQSWYEYSGKCGNYTTASDAANDNAAVLAGYTTYTTGGILFINPARDLSLPSYLTNGSLGQYNLQMTLTVYNNTSAALTPEIVIICMNSGIMTTIAGSTAIYTGLITKEAVVSASQGQAVSSNEVIKLTGGSLADMVSTGFKYMPSVKSAISSASGGARSGGAGRKLDSLL